MKKLIVACLFVAMTQLASAAGTSFTIFSNYDLDATAYTYCNSASIPTAISDYSQCLTTAQAAADGWFLTKSFTDQKYIQFSIDQVNVTGGLDITIECKMISGASIVTLLTDNKTTAVTDNDIYSVPEGCHEMRVGIKIGTADDGNDLTTNLEILDVHFKANITN